MTVKNAKLLPSNPTTIKVTIMAPNTLFFSFACSHSTSKPCIAAANNEHSKSTAHCMKTLIQANITH